MNNALVKKQDVVRAIMIALNKVGEKKSVTLSDVASAIGAELVKIETVNDDEDDGMSLMASKQPKTIEELIKHIENDY